ncbi:MAG: hypothetical protein AAFQ80_21365 [Cyanobacteria bacterium J06621_8]
MNDPTKITSKEISQYRQDFADYPEALDALDLIAESDGDLKESAILLTIETGVSVTREEQNILDELAQKCRQIICDDVFIDELMGGLLTAGVATLAASGQIPAAVATPVVIYLTKTGVKNWCKSNQTTNL